MDCASRTCRLGGWLLAAFVLALASAASAQRVNPEPGVIPDVATLKLPRIERLAPVAEKALAFTVDGGKIGAPRRNWPVRFAVPIPRGELVSSANVALKTADGRPVPVQARATCFWPEGEVKWLLLEFLCNLPDSGRADCTLVYGTKVAPAASRLKLAESAEAVTVDTEAVKFTAAKGEKFLRDFTVGDKRMGDLAAYLDYSLSPVAAPEKMTPEQRAKIPLDQSEPAKEVLHTAAVIDSVKVVEKGPVQVTLQLDGSYATKTVTHPVRIYVTAWAGSPLVQVKHSIVYAGYPERDMLRGYGLDLSLAGATDAAFGIEKGEPVRGRALIQKDDRSLDIDWAEVVCALKAAGYAGLLALDVGRGSTPPGQADAMLAAVGERFQRLIRETRIRPK